MTGGHSLGIVPGMGLTSRMTALAAAAAAAALGIAFLGPLEPPASVGHLETARSEGAKLQDRSVRLRRDIDEIAGNFEAAAGLSEVSAEIRSLTRAQQRSLERVQGLLDRQVASIAGTATVVEELKLINAEVADASAQQAEALRQNLAALRRVRAVARRTRSISTYFARQAAYGARLAEDSARSFGR